MRIRRFLIALLVVLGIVLSPLLAAAMIPALFVYDVAEAIRIRNDDRGDAAL